MTSIDPRSGALLDAFRRQHALAPTQRGEIWSRLEATLDAGEPDVPIESGRPRVPARRLPIVWIAAAALAAGVVLGIAVAPHAAVLVGATVAPHQAVDLEAATPPVYTTTAPGAPAATPVPVAVPPEPGPTTPMAPSSTATDTPRPAVLRPSRSTSTDDAHDTIDDGATANDTDALVVESGLLRRARAALQAGNARGALAILDAHAQAFPDGQMREDSATLRVEALRVEALREASTPRDTDR